VKREIDLLVEGGHVITVDAAGRRFENGSIAVDGGKIAAVGPASELAQVYAARRTLSAKDCIIIPALIDSHLHPGLYFFSRMLGGEAREKPGPLAFGGQVERFLMVFQNMAPLSRAQSRASAAAALLSSLKSGVTFFCDGAMGEPIGLAQAARDIGIGGFVTYDFGFDLAFDLDNPQASPTPRTDSKDVIARAGESVAAINDHGQVRGFYNVIADLTASDDLIAGLAERARSEGTLFASHTSSMGKHDEVSRRIFGKSSTARMADLGAFGPNFVGAHMGFLDADDVARLAQSGGHVAHCPGTAMGSGKGVVSRKSMLDLRTAGVNICLGVDSPQWAALPEQMRLTFYGHKDATQDDRVFPSDEVLAMATRNAARALGVLEERGSIEPGKVADLTVIDVSDSRYGPFADPLFGFVRAGHSGDVRDVIVGGEIKVRDGKTLGLDEAGIVARALEAGREYLSI
jgi:5-methylthioadenosine/S-adenosylhomocysteine deaminase